MFITLRLVFNEVLNQGIVQLVEVLVKLHIDLLPLEYFISLGGCKNATGLMGTWLICLILIEKILKLFNSICIGFAMYCMYWIVGYLFRTKYSTSFLALISFMWLIRLFIIKNLFSFLWIELCLTHAWWQLGLQVKTRWIILRHLLVHSQINEVFLLTFVNLLSLGWIDHRLHPPSIPLLDRCNSTPIRIYRHHIPIV